VPHSNSIEVSKTEKKVLGILSLEMGSQATELMLRRPLKCVAMKTEL